MVVANKCQTPVNFFCNTKVISTITYWQWEIFCPVQFLSCDYKGYQHEVCGNLIRSVQFTVTTVLLTFILVTNCD